jgi:hypothetical protein
VPLALISVLVFLIDHVIVDSKLEVHADRHAIDQSQPEMVGSLGLPGV